jgi:IS1 family transposase
MEMKMNVLSKAKQSQILAALVEGNSIRSTARMVGCEHKTVMRVLSRAGENCERILDDRMRAVPCRVVQMDEIWTYVGKHERYMRKDDDKERMGDQYVFIAMDSETKLIPAFRVGRRNQTTAWYFVQEVSERIVGRIQLTTDGFNPYRYAVEDAFGSNVDYAMLIKTYLSDTAGPDKRYTPGDFVSATVIPISGDPKPALISTSHIERQNLTIRMQMRRFTRLTNGYSKKIENLKAALALYFAWYNFCRVHHTLRVTPAMAANLEREIWGLDRLVA